MHRGRRNDLAEPLLEKPKKIDSSRRSWIFASLFFDVVAAALLYAYLYHFKANTFLPTPFNFTTSPIDVLALVLLRALTTTIALLLKKVSVAYWLCFTAFVLGVGKVIVWDYSSPWQGTLLVVGASVMGMVELRLMAAVEVEDEEKEKALQLASEMEEGKSNGKPAPKKELSVRGFAKVLKPYFWPRGWCNRLRVFMTWAMLVGAKSSNIVTPLFLGSATNSLKNGEVPYKFIGLYCLFAFFNVFFKQVQNIIYLGVKQTAYAELSEYTFRHLHMLSLEWHLQKKMGNVLRSMDRGVNSADTVVTYLFLSVGPSLAECGVVFVVFFAHFKQPFLAAIAFYAVTLYVVVTVQITQWRKKFRSAQNRHDNDLHDKATDSLINYETVKYFANEDFEIDRYCQSVRAFQRYNVSTQVSLSFLNTIQQGIIQTSMLGVLFVAAYQTVHGNMNLGDFVACNIYLLQLYTPLNFLGSIYNAIIQAVVDMRNLGELLAVDPDVVDIPNAPPLHLTNTSEGVALEFKDVWFQYPSDKGTDRHTLRGVSFTVAPGTTTAIVGHTGAGKSTLARLLFRFYDVTRGSVLVDGQDAARVQQKTLRQQIGVVPQDTVMFNDSIRYNLSYGKLSATQAELEEAAEAAQILSFIRSLPEGWDTKVGERGLKLSGGEKQRVAIARALLKNPPVVLLDEATSALDSITEKSVQLALTTLGHNRTTFVIAHRLSTIKHAHQIVVLDKGKVVERGTHEELLQMEGLYCRMWRLQERTAAQEGALQEGGMEEESDSKPAAPAHPQHH